MVCQRFSALHSTNICGASRLLTDIDPLSSTPESSAADFESLSATTIEAIRLFSGAPGPSAPWPSDTQHRRLCSRNLSSLSISISRRCDLDLDRPNGPGSPDSIGLQPLSIHYRCWSISMISIYGPASHQ